MKKLSKISLLLLSFILLFNMVCADIIDFNNPTSKHHYEEDFNVSPIILIIVGIVVAVAICALVYLGIAKKGQKTPENEQTVESSKEEQN